MSMMSVKDIRRRAALSKALFLAPAEIFNRMEVFINIAVDTFIEGKTGQRPADNFPLDFWPDKDYIPDDRLPDLNKVSTRDLDGKRALCKMLFLAPPSMFRDIERYFNCLLLSFIEKKTGRKPNKSFPLDFWINKGLDKGKTNI